MPDVNIDLSGFREFTEGDKELEKELFEEFIASSQELMETMKNNIGVGEYEEKWKKAAHALKGISYNLGAIKLGTFASEAQEGFQGDENFKREKYKEMDTELGRVIQFLNKEMA